MPTAPLSPAEMVEMVKKTDYVLEGIPLGFPFVKSSVEKCMAFDFHESDVVLVGYPKSGNTWLQEITWMILNDAKKSAIPIMERCPLIEAAIPNKKPLVDLVAEREPPRAMNTHLPHKFLSSTFAKKTPKVIVLMRNPKDVVVSYYHFYNTRPGREVPEFNDFYQKFVKGDVIFGDWFDYVNGWWEKHGDPNYHFTTYEDFKLDHYGSVEKMAKFLKKSLTEEQIKFIVENTTFSSMKSNAAGKMGADKDEKSDKPKVGSGGFFRKGVIGDWKSMLSEEQSQEIGHLYETKIGPNGPKLTFET